MADHKRCARINGRVREFDLGFRWLRHVFDAVVHRNDYDVAALAQPRDISTNYARICQGDAAIDVAPVSVALIVGIAEESKPDAMPGQHNAVMRSRFRFTAPYRLNSMGP